MGSPAGRTPDELAVRLPPGQYYETEFPVLTAGPTPRVDWHDWTFQVDGMVAEPRTWTSSEFGDLPFEDIPLRHPLRDQVVEAGTSFGGASLDVFLEAVEPFAEYAMVHSYGGYTTNLSLEDLSDGEAWVVTHHEGEPLEREHGGPARLLVPHLYFWKSAKWVAGLRVMDDNEPGFWEANGYHIRGDPWREERYWND